MDTTTRPVFPQALLDAFRRTPHTPAFAHEGRDVSRAEVLALVATHAETLRAAGLARGRTVGLRTGVTPDGFAAQIAAHLLGCRVIGLRPGLTPGQLAHVLGDGVHAVVTDAAPGADPELEKAAGGLPLVRLGPADPAGFQPGPAGEPAPPLPAPAGRPDDIAVVHLTSGSTGNPKGCEHSYRSLTDSWSWQPEQWTAETAELARRYGRYLLFGTLTSAVIFEHLGLCLLGGGTAVIPAAPFGFPEVIERDRPTALLMTVPRLRHVLDVLRTDEVDTGSLRALLVAGSPLPPHRLAEATERLGPVVYQAYGQTETGMLTLLTPDDIARRGPTVLDSVGRAWAHARIEVRDAAGAPVPAGTEGEVFVHTPGVMTGYRDDAREADEVLDDGGWVRTRDLGRLDADGFLRLTGRSRDVVIVNAIVHYTGPVEQVLAGHPDVDSAYVVGAPDERTGEAAHAFVVPAGDRAPDLGALRMLVADALGEAAVPATLTVVREVPVAPSGKPDKRALLDRYGPATGTPGRG